LIERGLIALAPRFEQARDVNGIGLRHGAIVVRPRPLRVSHRGPSIAAQSFTLALVSSGACM
jgi:hypothetical protein